MILSRHILIANAIKYNSNWDQILKAVQHNEEPEMEYIEMAMNMKCRAVTMLDETYPLQLKNIYKPPFCLFYYGDISLISDYRKCVSIVGSRENSLYGEKTTIEIASGLAKAGFNVVSGMAIGVDSIAQTSCIEAGGKTVAVLGGGIDCCYPASNRKLYEEIKTNHLVISEYYGSEAPSPVNFLIRNRIIAGLSRTLVVTEAKGHSGTLVTASLALQSNTDVMCVPYPAGEESKCNELIRAGAILVENSEQVIQSMNPY